MPVPTGTATPWRLIEDPSEDGGSSILYYKEGVFPGRFDVLAEQIRMDGIVPSTGPALLLAKEAEIKLAWIGYKDDDKDDLSLCDKDGWTNDGALLNDVKRCVVALIDLDGE